MLLLLCVVVGLATSIHGQEGNPDDYIHTLGATIWGFWGQTESCANGSYAYGFEIKVEDEHGLLEDDTSVNAIQLFCRTPEGVNTGEVTSSTMSFGSWTGAQLCGANFLNGYDLKSHADEGAIGDNTAANALRMYCIDESEYLEAPGNKWGHWLGPSFCRSGMAVCGIMTRVQEDQGGLSDDTALNDVRFLCCDLPA
ncbi:vitelline membrane outer layer protein 1 homolog [Procambarus clarkii]|uniref:vitelline membrane outer layer protein 1 homolog n=1 Tax=Procambarus clarkii TaxID=6728 RepID=UPI001E675EF7|nr:vitelline membrane outer layer protein 1 homolog [Procambarus clarkii]